MSEPRIGRFLVASLHQAIAELLPDRLEFYENWLSVSGLREGTIGLAPLSAVLSFLRAEAGNVYQQVVELAGRRAAEWTLNGRPALERRVLRSLPQRLRARAALRMMKGLVRATYPGTRVIVRVRRAEAAIDLRGSLFCEVRETSARPLCGFYLSALLRVFELLDVPADGRADACRAAGGGQGCRMSLVVRSVPVAAPAAAS